MSSIATALNSVASSLLNEIGTQPSSQTASTNSVRANSTAGTSASTSDGVNLSQLGKLFQELQQLENTDPAEFAQVTANAASQLHQAAQQSNNPAQANVLSNLADKFQQASQSGNLSAFETGAPPESAATQPEHSHRARFSTEESNSTQAVLVSPSANTPTASNDGTLNSNPPPGGVEYPGGSPTGPLVFPGGPVNLSAGS
ncbi:MAG TPA: hypothetical protein VGG72_19290 [Bryobacteraceae bacterium]